MKNDKFEDIIETEVLIIGGGLAGAYAAIKAKERGAQKVLIVDKSYVGKSGCSSFAAGVFTSFIPEEDDFDFWFKEIVNHGEYMNDQEWLGLHLSEVYERVREMDSFGVKFAKGKRGEFIRTPGRGEFKNIKFYGPQLMEAMRKRCEQNNIKLIDWVMMTDLVIRDGRAVGTVGFHCRSGDFKVFKAKSIVVTTGGCRFKTNLSGHRMTTGDGHAMLLRAGCEMMNLEINQSNLAAANFEMSGPGMNMYQGLGAKFVNRKGEEFLSYYDPVYKERTTLRMFSGAMAVETALGNNPFYIDMRHFSSEQVMLLKEVLPLPTKALERAGIIIGDKIVKQIEWLPIGPCWGSYGGGARINKNCETNISGLFVAGDASAKMAAGTNEMGAGALPNAAVTGAIAGRYASEYASEVGEYQLDMDAVGKLREETMALFNRRKGVDPEHAILSIQETITPYKVAIIKKEDRLKRALDQIADIRSTVIPYTYAVDPHHLRLAHEARNMALCAELFLHAALMRKESRGIGFREDFPFRDNVNWLKWIILKMSGQKVLSKTEDIPVERYKVRPESTITEHPLSLAGKSRGLKWE